MSAPRKPARSRSGRARSRKEGSLSRLSASVSQWTGTSTAFGCALGVIVAWAVLGPVVHYSDTWQLVINTGTTIVTFLMVFLLQRAQNKDALAIQLKLDELVAAVAGASNRLIDVESLTEDELETLRRFYTELSNLAQRDRKLSESHSIEEARARHSRKD
jgi:low affinity Fe/Cu permease